MPDAHANFAISAVATAPSPPTSGSPLVVTAGEGSRFPAGPFNATVWPAGTLAAPDNAEIVRVTGRSGDTFPITRAQESSFARSIVAGDLIAATITAKSLTDIETRPYCSVRRTAPQTISHATWTGIQFDVEDEDVYGLHDATNNTRLTIPSGLAGVWQLSGHVIFDTSSAGVRFVEIYLNNTNAIARTALPPSPGYDTAPIVPRTVRLAVGDYVDLRVYHENGSSLDIPAGYTSGPIFTAAWLGT